MSNPSQTNDDQPETETPEEGSGTESWTDRRWFRWTRDLVIFGLVLGGIFWFQTRNLVGTGAPAPDFTLSTLDGEVLNLKSFQGRPTILFFWAPWCGVCKADAHNIAAVHEAIGDEVNVASVALSYQDRDAVTDFVDEHGLVGPVILGDRAMARDYAIDSFPTVYILDEEGEVASHAVGYTTELGLRMRVLMAQLL